MYKEKPSVNEIALMKYKKTISQLNTLNLSELEIKVIEKEIEDVGVKVIRLEMPLLNVNGKEKLIIAQSIFNSDEILFHCYEENVVIELLFCVYN